jgi:hypothetical protein
MTQGNSPKLDTGVLFPAMTISMVDGSTFTLPDDLKPDFTIFLGYRGKW